MWLLIACVLNTHAAILIRVLNNVPAARGEPALRSPWTTTVAAAVTTGVNQPFLDGNTTQTLPSLGRDPLGLSMKNYFPWWL